MPVVINFKICDNAEACNGIRVCPVGAFQWNAEKKTLEIDEEKCINCGKCATSEESCQVGAIRFAKNQEELKKLKKEIEQDPRTIKDLMVDRYGAQPINLPFRHKESEVQQILTTKRPIIMEVFNEDSEECLIKSIPVKEIFDRLDIPNLSYKKVEVDTEEFMEKYDIQELPSFLMFQSGKLIGKIEGYYSIEEKEILFEKIKEIFNQNG